MASRSVSLELTPEQEETVKALFGHYGWEYKELTSETKTKTEKRKKCRCTARNEEVHVCADMDGKPEGAADLDKNGECQFCFMKPCITERELYFVGSGQEPCEDNSIIRKEIYKRYWKVINNAGGWNDPRYLAIKVQRANGGEWAIQHRREVMPMCVLMQLRTLYPNPKEKPYMDHMWN